MICLFNHQCLQREISRHRIAEWRRFYANNPHSKRGICQYEWIFKSEVEWVRIREQAIMTFSSMRRARRRCICLRAHNSWLCCVRFHFYLIKSEVDCVSNLSIANGYEKNSLIAKEKEKTKTTTKKKLLKCSSRNFFKCLKRRQQNNSEVSSSFSSVNDEGEKTS